MNVDENINEISLGTTKQYWPTDKYDKRRKNIITIYKDKNGQWVGVTVVL